MKQLVIRGNRVVAHGEDCFLCMGGTVICTKTGRAFDNATVANITGEIPADIDSAGYEYHAGEFVPCAPFGKGGGNVAVLCPEDCKSIKDSGLSLDNFTRRTVTSYIGTGKTGSSNRNSLTFGFAPKLVFISPQEVNLTTNTNDYFGLLMGSAGLVFKLTAHTAAVETFTINVATEGNTIEWWTISNSDVMAKQLNTTQTYDVIAFG